MNVFILASGIPAICMSVEPLDGSRRIKVIQALFLPKSYVLFACTKFTRVYNLHTCKYTPGMYFAHANTNKHGSKFTYV